MYDVEVAMLQQRERRELVPPLPDWPDIFGKLDELVDLGFLELTISRFTHIP